MYFRILLPEERSGASVLSPMPRLELHAFDPRFLGDAAALLVRRHAAHRTVEPALPVAYEARGGGA